MEIDKREDNKVGKVHCRKKGVRNVSRKGGAKQNEEDLQDEGAERACYEQGEGDGLYVQEFWLIS